MTIISIIRLLGRSNEREREEQWKKVVDENGPQLLSDNCLPFPILSTPNVMRELPTSWSSSFGDPAVGQ